MRYVWLALLLSFASSTFAAEPDSHSRFRYTARVSAPAGKQVRIWLPIPMNDVWQTLEDAHLDSPFPSRRTTDARFGNEMWYVEGKATGQPIELKAVYQVLRHPQGEDHRNKIGTSDEPARYLAPDRKVVFADKIRAISETEGKGKTTDDAKIRAYYDYVVKTMAYDKSGTGWGQGDAIWACDNKRGNCTDFHSLFIALSRISGVPARFFIGFPITSGSSGDVAGYHCWAEAYSAKHGWLPVDASEAKKSGKTDYYYGNLPSDRIAFSAGRDLVLEPKQKGEPLNYFVYPYVEVDGETMPKEAVATAFHFDRLARR